jgi:hypothetical protein
MSVIDLRELPVAARPCRAGAPSADPGGGRASRARSGAALIKSSAQFGTQSIIGVAVPVAVGL